MVPSALVFLPSLPLTATGKIHRAALDRRLLAGQESTDRAFCAPNTATEEVVASIWTSVLEMERISADDNFFALGGHSLAAIRVVYRLQEFLGIDLEARTLFAAQTLSELALEVEAKLLERLAALGEDGAQAELARRSGVVLGPMALADGPAETWTLALKSRYLALRPAQLELRQEWLRRALGQSGGERAIPRREDRRRAPLSWMRRSHP